MLPDCRRRALKGATWGVTRWTTGHVVIWRTDEPKGSFGGPWVASDPTRTQWFIVEDTLRRSSRGVEPTMQGPVGTLIILAGPFTNHHHARVAWMLQPKGT